MQDVSRESKLRLLMIYASINPEKFFESEKGAKLMQVTLVSYFYYVTMSSFCVSSSEVQAFIFADLSIFSPMSLAVLYLYISGVMYC